MYASFSEDARRAMRLANQQALHLNHEYIGTEHILLALCQPGFQFSFPTGMHVQEIEKAVRELVQCGPAIITCGKLPMTPRARKVVEIAIERAGDTEVCIVGLIDALYLESEGVASRVLMKLGYPTPPQYHPSICKKAEVLPSFRERIAALERRLSHIEKVLG